MFNISSTTLSYLNSVYSNQITNANSTETLKEAIVIERYLKTYINKGLLSDFEKFLNQKKIYEMWELSDSPKKIFIFDTDDPFLMAVLDNCVSHFAINDGAAKFYLQISAEVQTLYKKQHPSTSLPSVDSIRKHFYDTYFYNYNNLAKFSSEKIL